MKAARLAWFEGQPDLDPDRLVFLDETATNKKMARRYGWAPRGKRCRVAVPFGHWRTITVTTGLHASCLTATALLNGPMTGIPFRRNVEETLVPTLKYGDKVVLDILLTRSAASASPLRRRPPACSTCRPTRPILIRSNSFWPSPRPACVPKPPAQSRTSATPSNRLARASHRTSAATT